MSERNNASRKDGGKKTYPTLNLNQTYRGNRPESRPAAASGAAPHRTYGGMQSLGKVTGKVRNRPSQSIPELASVDDAGGNRDDDSATRPSPDQGRRGSSGWKYKSRSGARSPSSSPVQQFSSMPMKRVITANTGDRRKSLPVPASLEDEDEGGWAGHQEEVDFNKKLTWSSDEDSHKSDSPKVAHVSIKSADGSKSKSQPQPDTAAVTSSASSSQCPVKSGAAETELQQSTSQMSIKRQSFEMEKVTTAQHISRGGPPVTSGPTSAVSPPTSVATAYGAAAGGRPQRRVNSSFADNQQQHRGETSVTEPNFTRRPRASESEWRSAADEDRDWRASSSTSVTTPTGRSGFPNVRAAGPASRDSRQHGSRGDSSSFSRAGSSGGDGQDESLSRRGDGLAGSPRDPRGSASAVATGHDVHGSTRGADGRMSASHDGRSSGTGASGSHDAQGSRDGYAAGGSSGSHRDGHDHPRSSRHPPLSSTRTHGPSPSGRPDGTVPSSTAGPVRIMQRGTSESADVSGVSTSLSADNVSTVHSRSPSHGSDASLDSTAAKDKRALSGMTDRRHAARLERPTHGERSGDATPGSREQSHDPVSRKHSADQVGRISKRSSGTDVYTKGSHAEQHSHASRRLNLDEISRGGDTDSRKHRHSKERADTVSVVVRDCRPGQAPSPKDNSSRETPTRNSPVVATVEIGNSSSGNSNGSATGSRTTSAKGRRADSTEGSPAPQLFEGGRSKHGKRRGSDTPVAVIGQHTDHDRPRNPKAESPAGSKADGAGPAQSEGTHHASGDADKTGARSAKQQRRKPDASERDPPTGDRMNRPRQSTKGDAVSRRTSEDDVRGKNSEENRRTAEDTHRGDDTRRHQNSRRHSRTGSAVFGEDERGRHDDDRPRRAAPDDRAASSHGSDTGSSRSESRTSRRGNDEQRRSSKDTVESRGRAGSSGEGRRRVGPESASHDTQSSRSESAAAASQHRGSDSRRHQIKESSDQHRNPDDRASRRSGAEDVPSSNSSRRGSMDARRHGADGGDSSSRTGEDRTGNLHSSTRPVDVQPRSGSNFRRTGESGRRPSRDGGDPHRSSMDDGPGDSRHGKDGGASSRGDRYNSERRRSSHDSRLISSSSFDSSRHRSRGSMLSHAILEQRHSGPLQEEDVTGADGEAKDTITSRDRSSDRRASKGDSEHYTDSGRGSRSGDRRRVTGKRPMSSPDSPSLTARLVVSTSGVTVRSVRKSPEGISELPPSSSPSVSSSASAHKHLGDHDGVRHESIISLKSVEPEMPPTSLFNPSLTQAIPSLSSASSSPSSPHPTTSMPPMSSTATKPDVLPLSSSEEYNTPPSSMDDESEDKALRITAEQCSAPPVAPSADSSNKESGPASFTTASQSNSTPSSTTPSSASLTTISTSVSRENQQVPLSTPSTKSPKPERSRQRRSASGDRSQASAPGASANASAASSSRGQKLDAKRSGSGGRKNAFNEYDLRSSSVCVVDDMPDQSSKVPLVDQDFCYFSDTPPDVEGEFQEVTSRKRRDKKRSADSAAASAKNSTSPSPQPGQLQAQAGKVARMPLPRTDAVKPLERGEQPRSAPATVVVVNGSSSTNSSTADSSGSSTAGKLAPKDDASSKGRSPPRSVPSRPDDVEAAPALAVTRSIDPTDSTEQDLRQGTPDAPKQEADSEPLSEMSLSRTTAPNPVSSVKPLNSEGKSLTSTTSPTPSEGSVLSLVTSSGSPPTVVQSVATATHNTPTEQPDGEQRLSQGHDQAALPASPMTSLKSQRQSHSPDTHAHRRGSSSPRSRDGQDSMRRQPQSIKTPLLGTSPSAQQISLMQQQQQQQAQQVVVRMTPMPTRPDSDHGKSLVTTGPGAAAHGAIMYPSMPIHGLQPAAHQGPTPLIHQQIIHPQSQLAAAAAQQHQQQQQQQQQVQQHAPQMMTLDQQQQQRLQAQQQQQHQVQHQHGGAMYPPSTSPGVAPGQSPKFVRRTPQLSPLVPHAPPVQLIPSQSSPPPPAAQVAYPGTQLPAGGHVVSGHQATIQAQQLQFQQHVQVQHAAAVAAQGPHAGQPMMPGGPQQQQQQQPPQPQQVKPGGRMPFHPAMHAQPQPQQQHQPASDYLRRQATAHVTPSPANMVMAAGSPLHAQAGLPLQAGTNKAVSGPIMMAGAAQHGRVAYSAHSPQMQHAFSVTDPNNPAAVRPSLVRMPPPPVQQLGSSPPGGYATQQLPVMNTFSQAQPPTMPLAGHHPLPNQMNPPPVHAPNVGSHMHQMTVVPQTVSFVPTVGNEQFTSAPPQVQHSPSVVVGSPYNFVPQQVPQHMQHYQAAAAAAAAHSGRPAAQPGTVLVAGQQYTVVSPGHQRTYDSTSHYPVQVRPGSTGARPHSGTPRHDKSRSPTHTTHTTIAGSQQQQQQHQQLQQPSTTPAAAAAERSATSDSAPASPSALKTDEPSDRS